MLTLLAIHLNEVMILKGAMYYGLGKRAFPLGIFQGHKKFSPIIIITSILMAWQVNYLQIREPGTHIIMCFLPFEDWYACTIFRDCVLSYTSTHLGKYMTTVILFLFSLKCLLIKSLALYFGEDKQIINMNLMWKILHFLHS